MEELFIFMHKSVSNFAANKIFPYLLDCCNVYYHFYSVVTLSFVILCNPLVVAENPEHKLFVNL